MVTPGRGPIITIMWRNPEPCTNAPIRYELASNWLRKAEKLAGIESHDGSLWHAYRRGWATARKDLPVQDVAAAGGWKTHSIVQDIYQQADVETTLRVVLHEAEVQEMAQ